MKSSNGRRPFFFSFLLFFLPTSLLALSLLLACHGLGLGFAFLCLANSFPSPNPVHKPPPTIIYLRYLRRNPIIHHISIQLPHKIDNASAHHHPKSMPKHTASTRRRCRRWLNFLRPSNQSAHFSSRATAFFHSSSCRPRFFMTWISPLDSFGPRELFSIESVFKSHPNACLLIVSDELDSARGRRLLKPFSARGFQVAALSPDYSYLFKHTPAEVIFDRLRKGEVQPGQVPIGQNLSNLLRLVLLYKYGGVYIDTDVVVLKSFSTLRNVIGAQTVDPRTGKWTRLNNAVLVFDKGHPLLHSFIEEFAQTFDGSIWGYNGPYLVSRVVLRLESRRLLGFTVLPPPAFYPVDWRRVSGLFRRTDGDTESGRSSAKMRGIWKESFALHLWNRQSRRLKVETGSVVGRIMSEFCVLCNASIHTL